MGKMDELIKKSDRAQKWREVLKGEAFDEAYTAFLKAKSQQIAELSPGQGANFEFHAAERNGVLEFKAFIEEQVSEGDKAALELKTGRPAKASGRLAG